MTASNVEFNTKLEAIESRMDARVQHMETLSEINTEQTDELKREFRQAKWWALTTAAAIFVGMAGFLAITNSWQQTYLSSYTARTDTLQSKMDNVQQQMNTIQSSLSAIERAITK